MLKLPLVCDELLWTDWLTVVIDFGASGRTTFTACNESHVRFLLVNSELFAHLLFAVHHNSIVLSKK